MLCSQLGKSSQRQQGRVAFVAPTVRASSWPRWKLDGLTNPLAVSLGSNRSGRRVQQGLKHDLINLLVLWIFILLLKAAHTKHGSGRGPYRR